ncbi:glutamine-hydrolyzing GMP synthase [Candidatus Oleimmundimicrobium sp.]|uniref:glutamine-hydrolyzing GMP synthase n=1 Tax=Candidatus Oleimmundimicrobium sp. TaxID=3060597 RepID=UPI0027253A79|nr:glutamine-hydrolyzing GMP synthase [Candidatus Oleimmundimicrobium sp.]MDO8886003.1 glutamine-hydrolyzing GMP synthase [Candidatus Oleimmundimicrobium sp.]
MGGNQGKNIQKVLVLDFGAQYSRLIARRVRECKVYSEIVPYDISVDEIKKINPVGLILSGGPASVHVPGSPLYNKKIFELGIPILGICYGMQLMAKMLGGEVAKTGKSEYGKTKLFAKEDTLLFKEIPLEQSVWMSHRDSVKTMPTGFELVASTESTKVAAMENVEKNIYGVQFHPEVAHTPFGLDILKNFLYIACQCNPSWTMVSIIERSIKDIKEKVGKNKIICGLSGGVDSAVAAVLVHKAVGDQLTCVFVNHGLLRKGEAEQVEETFRRNFKINLVQIDARERFLKKLKGITDPEKKRVVIGEEFIRVFEEFAHELKDVNFLVQGTLYPDVIESGTRDAAKIKTHHNVGGLPLKMDFKLIEPLRLLFKDEVRAMGEELGLSEEIVWRQPFPGPGLAIRIIGEVTSERLEILRQADAIVTEETKRANLYRSLWQSFAVLACVKSVGVMGDERTYSYPIIIRAVTSEDAMTADWARLPYDVLERLSNRIINEVSGVNRVAYDISSKPPSTIEWE